MATIIETGTNHHIENRALRLWLLPWLVEQQNICIREAKALREKFGEDYPEAGHASAKGLAYSLTRWEILTEYGRVLGPTEYPRGVVFPISDEDYATAERLSIIVMPPQDRPGEWRFIPDKGEG